jgi:enoyl-CoA hydratase/carnithine racemase
MSAAFARPQKKNAITGAMYEALLEAFDTAERDPEVGALVMNGKGRVFTAGRGFDDFPTAAVRSAQRVRRHRRGRAAGSIQLRASTTSLKRALRRSSTGRRTRP